MISQRRRRRPGPQPLLMGRRRRRRRPQPLLMGAPALLAVMIFKKGYSRRVINQEGL